MPTMFIHLWEALKAKAAKAWAYLRSAIDKRPATKNPTAPSPKIP
jgi:hypothetical protein